MELMLSPLEGVLSGIVSSCSAGQGIVTMEAAGSAVHCLVPVEIPRAMIAVGKCGQSQGSRESWESIKMKDNVKPNSIAKATHIPPFKVLALIHLNPYDISRQIFPSSLLNSVPSAQ